MKSGLDLRPNPPPMKVTWTVTFARSIPSAPATSLRAVCGSCDGAQISHAPSLTLASADGGSMVACARWGT